MIASIIKLYLYFKWYSMNFQLEKNQELIKT